MYNSVTEDITNKIILEFAKTIEMFGFSTSEARLFVYLYLQDQPKTLDDMSKAFGKSKTTMSTSIRNLSNNGLVTLVWKKGVRKDLYEANKALFKTFMDGYISKWIEASSDQTNTLKQIQQDVEKRDTKELSKTYDDLADIIDFHQQIEISFNKLAHN
ncbi:GbsR/MarR family transcriptional regulator [Lentibacillus amyloliquefaciens]|uniref:HTH-type transcriptional regulator n=1 Tax=Lentibacillus amyloliquefaciens TaxID=1472767 RepID=A0A0U3W696_9BACI|nr:helix-turn-helix domain-containing protein [Lentibacillus amyloliquefaciens]ALX48704.1 transcriptional regulator [Lentibacillus amyloliquefaciens]